MSYLYGLEYDMFKPNFKDNIRVAFNVMSQCFDFIIYSTHVEH